MRTCTETLIVQNNDLKPNCDGLLDSSSIPLGKENNLFSPDQDRAHRRIYTFLNGTEVALVKW